jgi:hypothetical protein
MGVLIEELVYPEGFKDIRSCRLMSVFQNILTPSSEYDELSIPVLHRYLPIITA